MNTNERFDEQFEAIWNKPTELKLKTFISTEKNLLLDQAIEIGEKKKYTFHEVNWGDGLISLEPVEDTKVSLTEAQGYNQAIDQYISKLKELKE